MNKDKPMPTSWILAAVLVGLFIGSVFFLGGCQTNPCTSNPRNSQCFSADQLQKELNK